MLINVPYINDFIIAKKKEGNYKGKNKTIQKSLHKRFRPNRTLYKYIYL